MTVEVKEKVTLEPKESYAVNMSEKVLKDITVHLTDATYAIDEQEFPISIKALLAAALKLENGRIFSTFNVLDNENRNRLKKEINDQYDSYSELANVTCDINTVTMLEMVKEIVSLRVSYMKAKTGYGNCPYAIYPPKSSKSRDCIEVSCDECKYIWEEEMSLEEAKKVLSEYGLNKEISVEEVI